METKFRIYSAHDTNIANWMQILLDMPFPYKYVPYAASIRFEVTEENDQLYVQTLYLGHPVILGECPMLCPIDIWLSYMDSVMFLGDLKEECEKQPQINFL